MMNMILNWLNEIYLKAKIEALLVSGNPVGASNCAMPQIAHAHHRRCQIVAKWACHGIITKISGEGYFFWLWFRWSDLTVVTRDDTRKECEIPATNSFFAIYIKLIITWMRLNSNIFLMFFVRYSKHKVRQRPLWAAHEEMHIIPVSIVLCSNQECCQYTFLFFFLQRLHRSTRLYTNRT